MAKPPDYRRLSVAAKQAVVLDRQREPAVVCRGCETQLPAADLVHHLDRCTGPRAPHPLSRWINLREARRMGVIPSTLTRWVQRGLVRISVRVAPGLHPERRYLQRDVAMRVADMRSRLDLHNSKRRGKP